MAPSRRALSSREDSLIDADVIGVADRALLVTAQRCLAGDNEQATATTCDFLLLPDRGLFAAIARYGVR